LSGPNADCPPCVYAPENTHFAGGAGTCSCTPETFPECCYCGSEGGWGKIECPAG
jgi:hypothetical protein